MEIAYISTESQKALQAAYSSEQEWEPHTLSHGKLYIFLKNETTNFKLLQVIYYFEHKWEVLYSPTLPVRHCIFDVIDASLFNIKLHSL
jgi:hypothetical protein